MIFRQYAHKRMGPIIMVVITGLILTACSSSGTHTHAHTHTKSTAATKATVAVRPRSTTTKPVGTVPASFVTRANVICEQATTEIKVITPPPPPVSSPSTTSPSTQAKVIATFLDKGIPILRDTLGRLKALPLPSSAAGAKLQELYKMMSNLIQELTSLAGAYQSDNLAQATKIAKSVSTNGSSFNSGMASIGLRNCANL